MPTLVMSIQKDFNYKYKIESKSVYLPQLILVIFKRIQAFEERIINRLKITTMALHPIKIGLQDYGSFPSHTIYVNVTSKYLLQDW